MNLYCFKTDGLALTQSSAMGNLLIHGIETDAMYRGTWMSGRMIAIVRTIKKRSKGSESMKE